MTSVKAIQIGKDIDNARCNGNWAVIPDLARRYKKYNAEGTILEQTVLAETNFIQIINSTRSSSTVNFREDNPYHISMEDRLDPQQVRSIQNQLLAVIQLADPNDTNATQKEFAKIILARTHFECGGYEKAIDIINQLQFEKEQVSQGYGLVLFLQARAIKAICFELTGNEMAAFQSYQGVEALLTENSTTNSKSFIEWSEESLYRATLLGLREGSSITPGSLLEFMRQYRKITTVQPTHWRIQKRMTITRHSLRYVSQIYRQGKYIVPASTSQPNDNDEVEQDTEQQQERLHQFFIVEQSQLHTLYEKMLYIEVPLPRAGQVNTRVLDFVDQFASDFELIGTTAHDLRGFVEALDRASQRTFNSPLITRHLFHALVRLGEFEEAQYALQSYLYLVGLVSYGWKETHCDGQALATDKTGLNMPVPVARADIESNDDETSPEARRTSVGEIADIKNTEKEDIEHTLHVLITAIRMYSNDMCRGVDAVEMAEIAKELYQKQPKRERASTLQEIGVHVYRAAGIAYGLLGCQTFDPELRPHYHEKALNYLKFALELDPNAWETYYQLALQQADMRDISQSVQSITQAIQRNPTHISLWHLLTLLISCPSQGDYKQALKTCDIGLAQTVNDMDEENYDLAEQHMMYQMTRTYLLHVMHGPNAALESSETLFASFRKIAMPESSISTQSDNSTYAGAHHGMIVSGSLGNLSELQMAAEKRRGRSASNSMVHYSQHQQDMGSRSHDNVLQGAPGASKSTSSVLGGLGRARSASNLSANPSPLGPGGNASNSNQLLAVPDNGDVKLQQQQQQHHHHHHIHGLHLFGSRSSSRAKGISQQQEGTTASAVKGNSSIQSLPTSPYDVQGIAGQSVTSLQSFSPSVVSIQSIFRPINVPIKPSTRTVQRKQRSDRILSDLWLLTAQIFIKLGKLDEARKAVEEAENVDWVSNPQVWCVLGQLLQVEGDLEQAQTAFYKSLVIDPNDVACQLWLAKSHLSQQSQEIAEGILDVLTKSNGWDCAEAWFLLGEIYKDTHRLDRTKSCLFYALELESTTPIQPFSVLPRYI